MKFIRTERVYSYDVPDMDVQKKFGDFQSVVTKIEEGDSDIIEWLSEDVRPEYEKLEKEDESPSGDEDWSIEE